MDSQSGDIIFRALEFPVDYSMEHYQGWLGLSKKELIEAASRVWDKNVFDIPLPEFMTLFKENLTAPFFVFQVPTLFLFFNFLILFSLPRLYFFFFS